MAPDPIVNREVIRALKEYEMVIMGGHRSGALCCIIRRMLIKEPAAR